MNGPSEFLVTGTLRNWDITKRLSEIQAPTLVISGEFDEATPAINHTVHEGIAGSEAEILDGCSHMAFVEKPDEYMRILGRFLSRVETAVPATR
jgi:L-proline amide hydrolase